VHPVNNQIVHTVKLDHVVFREAGKARQHEFQPEPFCDRLGPRGQMNPIGGKIPGAPKIDDGSFFAWLLTTRAATEAHARLVHGILDSVKSHAITPCGCPFRVPRQSRMPETGAMRSVVHGC
jgi:hypothetical protein